MNTKTTLILALVAAAAVGYVVLVEKPLQVKAPEPEVKSAAVALFEPRFEDPDRVEVQRRDNKKLVFTYNAEDKSWKMLSPLEASAPEYQVKTIIDNIANLKYTRKYAPNDKERPSETGFEKPVAVVRLLKADKELAHVVVGSRLPTGKGNFVKVNGQLKVKVEGKDETVSDKDVMEARSESKMGGGTDWTDSLLAKIDTFRDKNVLKFDMADVKRVKVEGDRNFVLVKNGEDWVIESPVRGRADKAKAQGVPQALASLYVADFKDDAPASVKPYGLEPPRLKVSIETDKKLPPKAKPGDPNTQPADILPSVKSNTYVMEIGGASDATGKQFFARLGGKPWVFAINEQTLKSLALDVSELQDKKIATVDATKVKSIKSETSGGTITFTKQDKNWVDGDNKPTDAVSVEDLIKAVNGLQAVNYVDPKNELVKLDWDKPRARITLTQEGSLTPVTVLVGPASTSGKMVFVKNAAEQAVAAVTDDAVTQLLAGPVSYRDRSVMKFDRTRAKKVEITKVGSEPMTLTQKGAEWSMVQPVSAAVDRDGIRNLMQSLSTLYAKRIVAAGDKAKYGLDKPAVQLAVYVEPLTANPNTKVVGGEPKPAETPATKPAAAPASKPANATTKPATTRPVKSVAEQIKQINELLEYQKTNPKENPKATQMLRDQLAKLQAQAKTQPAAGEAQTKPALTDKPAEPAPPAAAAPIAETVLRLSLAQMNGKTYGAVDGSDLIYEVDNQVFTDVTAELHDRQVTRLEVNNVGEIEFVTGSMTLTFRKSGDSWKYLLDPVLPVDKDKLTKALDELKDIKTHRYVSYNAADLAKYGLDAPAHKVAFVLNGDKRVQVLISAKGPENDADKAVYAMLAGEKKVFLLKPDQVGKFAHKLDDFEKSDKPGPANGPANAPGTFGAGEEPGA